MMQVLMFFLQGLDTVYAISFQSITPGTVLVMQCVLRSSRLRSRCSIGSRKIH